MKDKFQPVDAAIKARAKELRQPLTPTEQKLWQRLSNRQLYGLKFRRQHPVYRFILDFYCYEHRLVVEIDGDSHAETAQQARDEVRTEWLEAHGYRVIRFTDREVEHNIDGALVDIAQACGVDV